MAIDDKLEKLLNNMAEGALLNHGAETVSAAIASIPYAGGAISWLIAGEANRRNIQRAIEVFAEMKRRLEAVEESAVNAQFFETEEFQTLLALVIQQLPTAHDRRKREIFGRGLANSALKAFNQETRKELFLRSLEELTLDHIQLLRGLHQAANPIIQNIPVEARPYVNMSGWNDIGISNETDRLLVQHLIAMGMVQQRPRPVDLLEKPQRMGMTPKLEDMLRAIQEQFSKPSPTQFKITSLGTDFLDFIDTCP